MWYSFSYGLYQGIMSIHLRHHFLSYPSLRTLKGDANMYHRLRQLMHNCWTGQPIFLSFMWILGYSFFGGAGFRVINSMLAVLR